MSESKPPEGSLADEFRNLGQNLIEALRMAWESPERRRLQQEIESGLREFGRAVESGYEEVKEQVVSGETQNRIREDLLSALQQVNNELKKATDQMAQRGGQPGSEEQSGAGDGQAGSAAPAYTDQTEKHEVHPDDVESTLPTEGREEIHPDDLDATTPPDQNMS